MVLPGQCLLSLESSLGIINKFTGQIRQQEAVPRGYRSNPAVLGDDAVT